MSANLNLPPWEPLGISRATYYRRLKAQKPLQGNKLTKKLLDEWVQWREAGIEIKPWRERTKAIQVCYAEKYLGTGKPLTPNAVRAYLLDVPREQLSKRKHIHASLSSLGKISSCLTFT